jgi:hypothetical protein
MSTVSALGLAPRPAGIAPAPNRSRGSAPLRAVAAPARRTPRMAYGVVAVAGALAIAAAQMMLSIMTTEGSYQVAKLTDQRTQLNYQSRILQDENAGLDSPQYLAANATALGMVIGGSPSYLRLSDGTILGAGTVANPSSSVNALGSAAVSNVLIAKTPLVTDPKATIEGAPTTASADASTGTVAAAAAPPPPLTQGLPSPSTH